MWKTAMIIEVILMTYVYSKNQQYKMPSPLLSLCPPLETQSTFMVLAIDTNYCFQIMPLITLMSFRFSCEPVIAHLYPKDLQTP
jgi:hypothetical protein